MKVRIMAVLTGAATMLGTVHALAEDADTRYPNKPVKIVIGYQPGGPTDMTARWLATKLQESLGQPFIVENKPGAGSNMASAHVAAAKPDGYTLLLAASQLTWNNILYKDVKYDAIKSFVPITEIMSSPAVLIASAKVPVKNVEDVIALAKHEPEKLSFASSGVGSVPHLSGELFQAKMGVQLLHVPYRGASAAIADLMGGQVDLYFMTALSAMTNLQSPQLKPLAVTSVRRLSALPNVPTMREAGVEGVEMESWNGLLAPAGTPKAIVDRLYEAASKALSGPDAIPFFGPQGAEVIGSEPQAFASKIADEVERGRSFIKSINLQVQ
ncbi:tripartite tricarboxylate transporter substrate binding protein [Candidimonas sp. SYP-B2681]|uniref:Bug family tripartite tricarboxylate transporter substrate binding protein n=1 Tax=Candidimonas sp. SYP-B2681 TaxID=2497686 RepID=UPI000F88A180|nr:tripartite tricarboxylate transporter substrate binding protein [Candidimonas sp. SYP-B2681]RTZ45548.1 tripartite tricarboxylate transporter substrate binding protein [Candidimonas sp. SYP-B2681]